MKNCTDWSRVVCHWSFVFGLAVLPLAPLRADAIEDGRVAFAQGDFPAAVRAFETAIASGGPSAGLYYNLGVAQLKAGQRPQAALNFRRAILLEPRMIDARMALSDIERSQGVARPKSDWRGFVAEKAPLKVLVVVGCALVWFGAFLLLFVIFKFKSGRKILPSLASVFLVGTGAVLFLVGTLSDPRIDQRHAAVVLADEGVTLLSAPADQSATVTKLPAGAALRILQRSGDWAYCQGPQGEKGWAPSKDLATVVPTA